MSGTRLENLAAVLAEVLAQWDGRDRDKGAMPGQARAGHAALAVIDDMQAALHRARTRLAAECGLTRTRVRCGRHLPGAGRIVKNRRTRS